MSERCHFSSFLKQIQQFIAKRTAPVYFSESFVQIGTAEFGPVNLILSIWKKCNGTLQREQPPWMTAPRVPFPAPPVYPALIFQIQPYSIHHIHQDSMCHLSSYNLILLWFPMHILAWNRLICFLWERWNARIFVQQTNKLTVPIQSWRASKNNLVCIINVNYNNISISDTKA